MPSERLLQVKHYPALLIVLQPILLFLGNAYHDLRFKKTREFVSSVGTSTALLVLILIAVYFFTENLTFPRTVFPMFWMLNTTALVGWRLMIKATATRNKRRTLVVGAGSVAEQLITELNQGPENGFEVVGVVTDRAERQTLSRSLEILGTREDIPALIESHKIEEVILTQEETSWKDRLVDSISRLDDLHARVSIVPSTYEILIGRIKHFNVSDIPLIEVVRNPDDPVSVLLRRLRDILSACVLSILFLPIWIVISIAIKITDGGSILYCQDRIGQWGKRFRLYKFRTMTENAEDKTGPILAIPDDPRLTRIGRFLRSYRIDETPQLINILKGEMSLVGPRPDRPEFVERFAAEIHGYNERHKVKPGITGLAQVRGRYDSDPAIKLKYDLAYIYNRSSVLDLVIIFETLRVSARRQGI
jgi:exopolysaccharide biosynthesis polyprenyl glycosylphosphotransferase